MRLGRCQGILLKWHSPGGGAQDAAESQKEPETLKKDGLNLFKNYVHTHTHKKLEENIPTFL